MMAFFMPVYFLIWINVSTWKVWEKQNYPSFLKQNKVNFGHFFFLPFFFVVLLSTIFWSIYSLPSKLLINSVIYLYKVNGWFQGAAAIATADLSPFLPTSILPNDPNINLFKSSLSHFNIWCLRNICHFYVWRF